MGTLIKLQRVLLVDDHPIVREGLRGLLAQNSEFSACGEARGVADGLEALRAHRPDAAIVEPGALRAR